MSNLFHFGTFDVSNYGDLLFPLIALKELNLGSPCKLLPISPMGGKPAEIIDCMPSVRMAEIANTESGICGALIGGGNIIHCMPSALSAYKNGRIAGLGYGNLWLGPATLLPENVPIVWNAPGVPNRFRNEHHNLVQLALRRVNYLSVRDDVSKEYLLEVWPDADINVVPDTAWALPKLWSHAHLLNVRTNYFSRLKIPTPDRTVVFHLNRRYLKGHSLSSIAGMLDDISETLSSQPILIAFAPCHGDGVLAREVAQLMASRPILMDSPQSLEEVAACVACSEIYLGSSMHGLITASAYGVPALAIARPDMAKFAGVSKLLEQDDLVFENWLEAKERILALNFEQRIYHLSTLCPRINHSLTEHWKRIQTEILLTPTAPIPNSSQLKIGEFIDFECEATDILLRISREDNEIHQRVAEAERKSLEQGFAAQRKTLERDLVAQRKILDAEIKRLKAKLTRIEGSLSWRLTLPLRIASAKYPFTGAMLVSAIKKIKYIFSRSNHANLGAPTGTGAETTIKPGAKTLVLPNVSSEILKYQQSNSKGKRRYVIYTAIFGDYDQLLPPQYVDDEVDYICFTDRAKNDCGIWQLRPSPYYHPDPTRTARYIKTHPHELLKEYDYAIWLDANVVMKVGVRKFIDSMLVEDSSFGTVPHPHRNCLFQEAEACKARKKDQSDIIDRQTAHYRRHGLRPNGGLFETGFMIVRLADKDAKNMFFAWWKQIELFSRRDQLGLAWALHEHAIAITKLLPEEVSVREDEDFAYFTHAECRSLIIPEKVIGAGKTSDPYGRPKFSSARESTLHTVSELPIDIVVCVYNALEDVRLCLDSVRQNLLPKHRLIIINDKSDAATSTYLAQTAAQDARITLINNEENLGYTRSANLGLATATAGFRILLNSDTIVSPDWALKMLSVANQSRSIGIVGPLSNAAGYQSIPRIKGTANNTPINEIPTGLSLSAIDSAVESWSLLNTFPLVPLVHGFCFGVKQEVIERIGYFDDKNFERYYGEENDYCFRARAAGFDLAIATNAFIYHRKSRSIEEEERIVHMAAAGKKLREIYGQEAVKNACLQIESHPLLVRMREHAASLFG